MQKGGQGRCNRCEGSCPRLEAPSEVDEVAILLPMGLQEDAVDVVDVDGLVGTADGLDHAANAEVASLAQDAVG